jgi:hypothetical protein
LQLQRGRGGARAGYDQRVRLERLVYVYENDKYNARFGGMVVVSAPSVLPSLEKWIINDRELRSLDVPAKVFQARVLSRRLNDRLPSSIALGVLLSRRMDE